MRLIFFLSLITLICINCVRKSNPDIVNKPLLQKQFEFHSNDSFPGYNFTMTRQYFADSSFKDSGLLCQADTAEVCAIVFKKADNFWYVRTPDGWHEFYNPTDSLLQVVYFKEARYILKPVEHDVNYNKRILKGFIKEDLYVHSSHNSYLYFDPEFGVVLIEGDGLLVRNDFEKRTQQIKQPIN